ncbi:MAG: hypothetical protein ACTHK0_14550 [Ginsengibacter sp.]
MKQLLTARNKEIEKRISEDVFIKCVGIDEKERFLCSLYFNFPGWTESKAKGISYADNVRANVNPAFD